MVRDPADMVNDDDLKSTIQELRQYQPFCGVSMLCGNLRARGIKVTRERVRCMLRSIDPLGRVLRCFPGSIKRQPYSVPGPNSLWHIGMYNVHACILRDSVYSVNIFLAIQVFFYIDSHHKLIRWRLVTHGAIDGYSRLVMYLKCRPNNRSSTVYELFLNAIQLFNLPSRVRSDQGSENLMVARHMIEKRGSERRSMLTGSSTHNQRIERLWRDMHGCVTLLFYKIFYFMEQQDLLDPLNEIHLWALQYVFLPRINRSLCEFVHSWNHHPIRTAHHKTPHQLFTAGCLLLQNSGIGALDFTDSVDENYGIDPDGSNTDDVSNEDAVLVPERRITFADTDIRVLNQQVDPLGPSDNYGIDVYEQTVQFISTLNQI